MSEVKEYKITREQCQASIDARMPVVCSSCGGKIDPLDTVDNSYNPTFWSGCKSCFKFDYGVKPEIYEAAVRLFEDKRYRRYSWGEEPNLKDSAEYAYWRHTQISGAVTTIKEVLECLNPNA